MLCYCKRRNCAESLISGTALHRRARSLGFESFGEAVEAVKQGAEAEATVGQAEFLKVWTEGRGSVTAGRKKAAQAFLEEVSGDFCRAFWNYGLVFQPDAVILGGGMAGAFFPVFCRIKEQFDRESRGLEDFVPPFELLSGEGEGNPALAGAAGLFEA